MPYDAFGTFTRLYNWQDDRDNGIKIRADRMDAEMDGFTTGLNLAFLRDGRAAMSGNIALGTNKITGMGSGTVGAPSLAFSASITSGLYYNSGPALVNTGVQRLVATTTGVDIAGVLNVSGIATIGGKLNTVATAVGSSGLNLPHGTAPSAPTNGDVWTTTSGLYARINGATKGPYLDSAIDVQEFSSSGTWTKPTTGTPKLHLVEIWGAGGGGGGGGLSQTGGGNTHYGQGGGAGGGGGYYFRWYTSAELAATETVTIGAGGSGGTAGTTPTNDGGGGGSGGTSTFSATAGKQIRASGGGGGNGGEGSTTTSPAASTGGQGGQGATTTNLGVAGAAGQTFYGGLAALSTNPGLSWFGGGAGGSTSLVTGSASYRNGWVSYYGGGGGGAGGCVSEAPGPAVSSISPGTGEGLFGSTTAGSNGGVPVAGTAGNAWAGGGGGGAGITSGVAGTAGGAGGRAGGGGGGGAGYVANGGAGGAGGAGFCRVTTF